MKLNTRVVFPALAAFALMLTVARRRQKVLPPASTYIRRLPSTIEFRRRIDDQIELRWTTRSNPSAISLLDELNQAHALDIEIPLNGQNFVVLPSRGLPPHPVFRVEFEDGTTTHVAQRFLPVQGAPNLRDLGGYRTRDGRSVRWGKIYRSGTLNGLTERDLALIESFGLRWVCDLRSAREIAEEPDRLPQSPALAYTHLDLVMKDDALKRLQAVLFNRRQLPRLLLEGYTDVLIDRNAARFGELLRRLSDPDQTPALIHCTAGKDRTGIAAALLLLALGVPEATVVADYTLSNQFYDQFLEWTRKTVRRLRRFGVRAEDLRPLLLANADTMHATLAHVRVKYGSVERYLRDAAGVDDMTLEKLRATLLE